MWGPTRRPPWSPDRCPDAGAGGLALSFGDPPVGLLRRPTRRRRPRSCRGWRRPRHRPNQLDATDPRKPSVIRLALTATASQHPAVLGDFRDFVHRVRPDTGADSA
ncbi:hypothetical protein GCM10010317_031320 [Streptomyces mirabilis]|nr:hypothetical protein GCM10010317_031320 [Streptomyces mirabilis]